MESNIYMTILFDTIDEYSNRNYKKNEIITINLTRGIYNKLMEEFRCFISINKDFTKLSINGFIRNDRIVRIECNNSHLDSIFERKLIAIVDAIHTNNT